MTWLVDNSDGRGVDATDVKESSIMTTTTDAKQKELTNQDQSASEASESETESEDASTAQSTIAELRKRQNIQFKALLSKRAEAITASDIKRAVQVAKDSELSMSNLIAKQDFASVIHDPREYQVELFERARDMNIIAVLDTGSGKTLIAVLLLQHIMKQELIDRSMGKPHRIAFFLVDSVALVYQQAAVLENNIDQRVDKFCGAMETHLWDRKTWAGHFNKSMIIVCTAEVLHQCLCHSFIRMDQINLLIFDEAHHAKKDHAYARILKDFYMKERDVSKRPKIFGMTASPVDAKVDVVKAARNLEMLLDAQIATASNPQLLRQSVARPMEETWVYPRLDPPFETDLYKELYSRFGDVSAFDRLFRFALEASSTLGAWCSDWVWSYALAEDVLPQIEARTARKFMKNMQMLSPEQPDSEVNRIQAAGEIIKAHKFEDPQPDSKFLSPKVRLLHRELSRYFERHTDTKCIVFTEQRHTARILGDLFTRIRTPHLRPGWLIGVRARDNEGMRVSHRQQFMTLMAFRKGELNCLFATSVGEEGLDIPDCNLVVRFDLYSTLVQYVQSRGRARHPNSTFAHMIERDNMEHEALMEEVKRSEEVMQRFCASLPEDRILHGADDFDAIVEKDRYRKSYRIDSTGATLTYHSSLAILAHYASSLQYENEMTTQVHYYIRRTNDAFICEVVLPEKSPVRGQMGKPASQKSLAKQSAAFETCLLLRKNGLLDEHFVSTYHKRLPAMRNARLGITSKKTNQYDMMVKPKFWQFCRGMCPVSVYATVIKLRPSQRLQRQHDPLVLITRKPLPSLPHFPLFLENNIETKVECTNLNAELTLSGNDLDLLTTFTLRMFQDVFNKVFEREPHSMPYWLAPAKFGNSEQDVQQDPRSAVNWDILQFVEEHQELPWPQDKPASFFEARFIVDKWDGRYRYFTLGVEPNLRPTDPPPPTVARRRHMENIMSYCLSLYKNARKKFLETCDWDQPVLRAELLQLRRNLLDKMTEQEQQKQDMSLYYICLEPLKISAIPAPLAASAFTFPAIITRIESYLISLEACEMLQLKIPPHLALESLTKDSKNTEEHRSQQINFQRGMGNNYERLEFLGDCFLKMATSISLFAMNPDNDEFDFHVKRMCLICNKNLYNTAVKVKLYEFIRSQGFSRRTWYPDGLKLLQGKGQSKDASNSKHALADKTIADVCEALIGASLLSGGESHRFDMAVKAVTTLVNSNDHNVLDWKSYLQLYSLPNYQIADADAAELDLAKQVEEKLGYHFSYPKLLRSAFTHPSYPSAWARVPCYQRLEFLGDSLLDMVCVEYLFHRHPDKDPQWLTEHKMAMVSNKFLGSVAVRLGLHRHLNKYSTSITGQINSYVEEIEIAESEHGDAPDAWTLTGDPPKCLPDMVEAYIGAIFVDSGFRFEVVEDFFRRFLQSYFEDMTIYDTFANKHPTTHLHNRLTIDFGCSNYCVKAGEVPNCDVMAPERVLAAVIIHDEVVAEGIASSARSAKIKASEAALAKLEGLPAFKFRQKYGCDCKTVENTAKGGEATKIEDVV
ncbi:hypothetical protein VTO42DRAFT_8964 [Malbranchea cinnamomea]